MKTNFIGIPKNIVLLNITIIFLSLGCNKKIENVPFTQKNNFLNKSQKKIIYHRKTAEKSIPYLIEYLKDENLSSKIDPEDFNSNSEETTPPFIKLLRERKLLRKVQLKENIPLNIPFNSFPRGIIICSPMVIERSDIPYLIKMLEHKIFSKRFDAIMMLGDLGAGSKKAVPSLLKLLKRGNEDEQCIVAYNLGKIGLEAKKAIPALLQLTKNKNEKTREIAKQALKKITERK